MDEKSAIDRDRYNIGIAKALKSDLAQQAREHYSRLSDSANEFNSVIPSAINVWECIDDVLMGEISPDIPTASLLQSVNDARLRSIRSLIDYALRVKVAAAVQAQREKDAGIVETMMASYEYCPDNDKITVGGMRSLIKMAIEKIKEQP
jgi:hypothetical protein